MKNIVLAILVVAGMGATSAMAVPIAGFGDPLGDAALAGGTQEGFDSVASGEYASLTLGDVTYSGIGAPFTVGVDFNGSYNTSGGKSIFNDFDLVPDAFRFDFATAVSAFAFNWGAADNTWDLLAFDASDSLLDSLTIAPVFASNNGEYFGIAAANISYAILRDTHDRITDGDYVFIDRFTIAGGAVAVPEPTTVTLLGLGLLGFFVSRRSSRS